VTVPWNDAIAVDRFYLELGGKVIRFRVECITIVSEKFSRKVGCSNVYGRKRERETIHAFLPLLSFMFTRNFLL
jgi:hypothetical protein